MILWCDGAHDPAENMRRDGVLLDRLENGGAREAVLRLFRFEPHGITLGAAQAPERVLDLARCERAGVPWAVRPTGGRAIFHAQEWTYSLTARIDDPEWGGSLRVAYARAAALLIASLLRLGVPVEPATAGTPHASGVSRDASGACFNSTGGHEIVLAGRKLVGSAQRRRSLALLQQGSVLLGCGHLRLADCLDLSEPRRIALREELDRRTAHAGRWIGSAPLERWADALAAAVPGRPDRLDGEAGWAALTLPESASYTPAFPTSPDAPA